MNYKDLQNIASLSQQILVESSNENYDAMNRWPYASPYLQEERAKGVKPYRPNPTQAEVRADARRAEERRKAKGKDKEGYGPEEKFKDWKLTSTPGSVDRKGRTVSQRMDAEKPYGKRMTGPLAREYGSRTASEVTRVVRGPGEPQAVTMPRMKGTKKEDFDMFDLIMAHLLDEGFAETPEAATAIMANMSEDWIYDIVEMFGPSVGLDVARTRSQSTSQSQTTKPKPKPQAKPKPQQQFRPDISTATRTFGTMLQH